MSEPCSKEQVLTTLQVRQAEIAGDISYIKNKLDNGMSTSIKNIEGTLSSLSPIINHHAGIVKRIEDVGWALSTSLVICVLGVVVWAIKNGFNPKI
jgi:hypothetical protein